MRTGKNGFRRITAMICALALCASMMPTAVFATASEATTPTPEPTPIVATTPTPEPSESPENTDATVTTSAPDTGTGSTAAPVETPTETPDGTPVPSEKPVEQQVKSVPQTLAAASVPAENGEPEARDSKVIYSDADAGINVQLGDRLAGIPQTVTFVVSVDGVQKTSVRLDSVPLTAAPLKVDADNWNCNVYGDGVVVALAVGGYNLTFDSSKDEYTVHIDFKSPTGQLTMKNADGSIDLGTVTYKTGWDQNTTIRVYLNYELVQTFEDVYISASNEVADYNNFQVETNGDYYLKGVKLVDSSIGGQTVGYTKSNQHLFFGLPYQSGENTIALYFFDYKNGVNVDFSRFINDVAFVTSELDKACDTLNISFTYNDRNISYDYNDWGRLYLPKGVDITVTPTIKSGYYFEYWRTSDIGATQNALYSVLPDASWQLEGDGTSFKGVLALTEKMGMHFEDSDYPDMNIHLYMTDGTRDIVHKKITYNSNYPLDAGMVDISEQQYFYTPSEGLRHGTRILGEMTAPAGYEFLYWTTEEDGTGTKYMPGDLYGTDGSGDLTLYAQWKKIDTPPVETSVALKKTILSVKRDGQVIQLGNGEMLKVGDVVTYQIKVTNDGDTNLSNVTVTDTFNGAGGLSFGSDGNGSITMNGNGFTWTSDVTLTPGESNTLTYTYTVVDADKGKTITNTATIDGEDPTDDGKTETEVENPDVTVTKLLTAITRNGDSVKVTDDIELKVGDKLTYVINIVNSGNVDLEELTVTDTFDGHFAPSAVKDAEGQELSATWTGSEGSWQWNYEIAELKVNATATYTYTYTVNQADAGNKLTNTAVVTGDELDPENPPEDKDEHEVTNDGDITLQPADITIYMGGKDGYAGAAGGDSSSLPEPGFYITLPDKVEDALKTGLSLESGAAADLSGVITEVTATTTNGAARRWTMRMYGESASTAWINNQEHFVYRIVPDQGQDPISVNFTKEDGTPVREDTFTLTDSLSETYLMSLNTAGVDVETISLTFNINGEIFHCGYDAENSQEGTLTVRYASEEHDTNKAVTSENNLNPDTFGVVVGSNQLFNINQEDVGADGVDVKAGDVSLLADNIVSGNANEYVKALTEKAQEEDDFASSSVVQAMYLDLVDAENGNAWLTTKDNAEVTVFWPYPEGINKESDIQLIHFKGLDRDMATNEVLDEIEETVAINVPITKGESGFTFKTSSFSPFVLVQNTTQPSGGGDEPSGGDDGNNDNNNNSNNSNTAKTNVVNNVSAPAAPATTMTAIPQTGDESQPLVWVTLVVLSGAALAGLAVYRKKRSDK